jgi:signal transduction histidine kinase
MDLGTLGDRRQAEFDALYTEAKQVLSQSANQLKAVTERLRQSHAGEIDELGAASDDGVRRKLEARLSSDSSLLTRLEVVARELEQSWRFLERGSRGSWTETQRIGADDPDPDVSRAGVAMQILEAREQERATVAAELHDGPAQAMANAVFQVDIIDRTLRSDPLAARTELMALRGELDRELERLRGFIHQLHPSLQGDEDLEQAIDELATRLKRDNGIDVDVRMTAPLDLLDGSHRRAVLRVAQEALRNVRKHAAASHVDLSTFIEEGGEGSGDYQQWIMEIADNGRGFPVDDVLDQTSKRHFGLRFMRERAQLIGARLEIVSNPAVGTTVRLALEPANRS